MPNNISQEAALVGQMVQKGSLFGSISEKGAPGKDGKTPVKGIDYWTEADKIEIIKEAMSYPDYAENDPTSKSYIKNRPGGYVQETLVDIEWDGNTEGKYVVDIYDDFFRMCKVSDTPVTLEKLKGSTFTVVGVIEGKEVYESVTDFLEDAVEKCDDNFDIFVITPQKELEGLILVVNSAPFIIGNEEDGTTVFNEVGVYFSDIKGFDDTGSKFQLRSVKNELIKKIPSKYLDLDNINTSIQEISETLEPLPKKVDSLQIDSSGIQKRLGTVENRAKNAQDRLYKIERCLSINYNPQKAIMYYVASIKDTTEIVDITLPEESKTISIYFEPKAEFNIINKTPLYFVGGDSQCFPAKQYNMQTSKWVNLHRTRATNYESWAYVDDDGQLAVLYVAPDDVGKTVAMTREYAWKTIKLPDRSGFYSKEYVLIEYTQGTYVNRIDVSGDWTSESEPSVSGKGVRQITLSTLERIEQLTDDYINNLIDTKLGVIENGSY